MVLVVQMKGMPELVHVCWVTGGTGYRGTIKWRDGITIQQARSCLLKLMHLTLWGR
jgi:hypothetical protein